ncbi:hypothetical protein Y032_0208g2064 [Ancylostoma ceylanicum]|uniref:Uncharacterized protein n=1 Tax=Ancylostoma ceylanicum TaxID=53326 RepID=A0A016SKK1_9BILA|nr:hypothetical protein Y032_0208g2064 [Ancylostoma ceylanicum]
MLLCCLILPLLVFHSECHCPHMMGMKMAKQEGPSPPSSLPDGDKGWDFDEPSGAPGAVPPEYFIQTTFVHRSENKQQKDFAALVLTKIGELRQRLKQQARLTIDNEVVTLVPPQISCVEDSEHYRCGDYQPEGSYHYLVVEDSAKGAAVYSLERKLNEKNPGATEMAVLDALSRHSPHSLTMYASPEADKEVGFVRALSAKELQTINKPPPVEMEFYSPTEVDLIDTDLLEFRTGEDLDAVEHNLVSYASEKEFSDALNANKELFVLFWSHVHTVSLHAFNLWARTSKKANFGKDVILAHVECHRHADFCHGLTRKDFHTVVAYRNGQNIGSTYYLRDEDFYLQWMYLMLSGPLIELRNDEDVKNAKKGLMFGSVPHPVTIGTFPDRDCTAFQHYSIAADRFHGRYFMAVRIDIKPGSTSTVSTYRPYEKQRRRDYEGKFDPASLMGFVSTSSFPSVIDITNGFTTNLLFRQHRKVAILVAPSLFSNVSYVSLASGKDARKFAVFTYLNRDQEIVNDVMKQFKLPSDDKPQLLLLDKQNVHQLLLDESTSPDSIWEWMQERDDNPTSKLSVKDPHPLRFLQKARIDSVFGHQNTLILADDTLFQEVATHTATHSVPTGGGTGGCPFMSGAAGGGAMHEEL